MWPRTHSSRSRDLNLGLSEASAFDHKPSYQRQRIYVINSGSLTTKEPNCFKMNYKVANLPSEAGKTKRLEGENTVVRNIPYSLKCLELGQAGHRQVNYLYLAGDGDGDRLSF